jgi:hypothetical protein
MIASNKMFSAKVPKLGYKICSILDKFSRITEPSCQKPDVVLKRLEAERDPGLLPTRGKEKGSGQPVMKRSKQRPYE